MRKEQIREPEKNIEQLRQFVIQLLILRKKDIQDASGYTDEYSLKLKSWSIVVYMAAIGFCLSDKNNLGIIYYFLPILPVLIMWLLHAYIANRISKYMNHGDWGKINSYLKNIFKYSYKELEEVCSDVFNLQFNWLQKGEFHPSRFLKEKLPGMCRAFVSAENIMFYGVMILIWIALIYFHRP